MSQNTLAATQEFATLEIDLIRVKGKTKPVKIFALLGGPVLKEDAAFKMLTVRHERMLAAYRKQRWDNAEEALEECLGIKVPGIELALFYEVYASRIRAYRKTPPVFQGEARLPSQGGPPDATWDGVTTADSK